MRKPALTHQYNLRVSEEMYSELMLAYTAEEIRQFIREGISRDRERRGV